jgi:hypothetical protein
MRISDNENRSYMRYTHSNNYCIDISILHIYHILVTIYESPFGNPNRASEKSTTFRFAAVGVFRASKVADETIDQLRAIDPQVVLALADFSYKETAECWHDLTAPIEKRKRIAINITR